MELNSDSLTLISLLTILSVIMFCYLSKDTYEQLTNQQLTNQQLKNKERLDIERLELQSKSREIMPELTGYMTNPSNNFSPSFMKFNDYRDLLL